jgi:hypothetical protein
LAKVSDYIKELQRKNASMAEGVRNEASRRSKSSLSSTSSSNSKLCSYHWKYRFRTSGILVDHYS